MPDEARESQPLPNPEEGRYLVSLPFIGDQESNALEQ